MRIVCGVLGVLQILLLARALLSWFPARGDGLLRSVQDVLTQLTEPILAPLRKALPLNAGGFDLTFMVLVFGLSIARSRLGCGPLGI
jgi:YggT family protein